MLEEFQEEGSVEFHAGAISLMPSISLGWGELQLLPNKGISSIPVRHPYIQSIKPSCCWSPLAIFSHPYCHAGRSSAPTQRQAKGSTRSGWNAERETLPVLGDGARSLKKARESLWTDCELGIWAPDANRLPLKISLEQQSPQHLPMITLMKKAGFCFKTSRGTMIRNQSCDAVCPKMDS